MQTVQSSPDTGIKESGSGAARAHALDSPLNNVKVDPDIQKLLGEASLSWLLPSEAYQLGVIDGRNQVIDSANANAMKAMIPIAEMFYDQLRKVVPKESIRQHRIGIDKKTGVPTSLTVISSSQEKDLTDIMRMARRLERGLFQVHDLDYSFWVITDKSLDQGLIELDFPYYKSNVNADK